MGAGAAALLGSVASAQAAPQAAVPIGDDSGFLAFGATAESVGLAFYKRARALGSDWTPAEHTRLGLGEQAKRLHVAKLNAALGPNNAVLPDDFAEVFAPTALNTRAKVLALGEQLEGLVVGVYLNGVGYAKDPGTRILLGRLLSSCSEQLAQLRVLAGKPASGGLAAPIDLEPAGARLDRFLKDPS
jgi:hypothetical protein